MHRTDEQKQALQKEKRNARKYLIIIIMTIYRTQSVNEMTNEEFRDLVSTLIGRLSVAFTELQGNNDAGKIKIERPGPLEIIIRVQKIGAYKIYAEAEPLNGAQHLYLQSPQSGLYNYKYNKDNDIWRSE